MSLPKQPLPCLNQFQYLSRKGPKNALIHSSICPERANKRGEKKETGIPGYH